MICFNKKEKRMESCDICFVEYKKGSGGGFPLVWCHNCNKKICEMNKECQKNICIVFNAHHNLNLSYCKKCIPDEKEWVGEELCDWEYDDQLEDWIGKNSK